MLFDISIALSFPTPGEVAFIAYNMFVMAWHTVTTCLKHFQNGLPYSKDSDMNTDTNFPGRRNHDSGLMCLHSTFFDLVVKW